MGSAMALLISAIALLQVGPIDSSSYGLPLSNGAPLSGWPSLSIERALSAADGAPKSATGMTARFLVGQRNRDARSRARLAASRAYLTFAASVVFARPLLCSCSACASASLAEHSSVSATRM